MTEIARHTRDHLWGLTDVIVVGGNQYNPGTFWRIPTDLKSWTPDQRGPIGADPDTYWAEARR